MNGLIILAIVCYGFAMLGAGALVWEWILDRRVVRKVVDEFLLTLPLMNGD